MALEFPPRLLSYEEYAAIDDGNRYQVLEGELVPMPSPSPRHQDVVLEIAAAMRQHVRAHAAGKVYVAPLDVVLCAERPAVVVQPDVIYVAATRAGIVGEHYVEGPPDIVVEVLSPSNAREDTIRKLALYARHGVPEYWMVPFEFDRVEVLRLDTEGRYGRPELFLPGDTLTTASLPGLAIEVAALFGRPEG